MSTPLLYGKIQDGVIYVEDINTYHQVKHSLEGKRIQIKLEPFRQSVTEQQYNFYWGIVIGQYCLPEEQFGGWSKEEVDHYLGYNLRSKYLLLKKHDGTKPEYVVTIPSVSHFSRAEMAEYIQNVIVFLSIYHKIVIEYKSDQHDNT